MPGSERAFRVTPLRRRADMNQQESKETTIRTVDATVLRPFPVPEVPQLPLPSGITREDRRRIASVAAELQRD